MAKPKTRGSVKQFIAFLISLFVFGAISKVWIVIATIVTGEYPLAGFGADDVCVFLFVVLYFLPFLCVIVRNAYKEKERAIMWMSGSLIAPLTIWSALVILEMLSIL